MIDINVEGITMDQLRYPIGLFQHEAIITNELLDDWIFQIEETPSMLMDAVKDLDDEQLNTAYRPEGWTVRQVIHHLADSHMNAYIRLKLALTEDSPTIKPYEEDQWAKLPDSLLPIHVSLNLLEALHCRWVVLLKTLMDEDLEKVFIHPELGKMQVKRYIGLYAWHGKHHIAHITSLRKRLNWD